MSSATRNFRPGHAAVKRTLRTLSGEGASPDRFPEAPLRGRGRRARPIPLLPGTERAPGARCVTMLKDFAEAKSDVFSYPEVHPNEFTFSF
jgi:hypothetical protein